LTQALQVADNDSDPVRVKLALTLGNVYVSQGRYAEAEHLLINSLKECEALFGDKNPYSLTNRVILAHLYLQTNRHAEAEQHAAKAYRIWQAIGELNPMRIWSQAVLAEVYIVQGRETEARPLLQEFREKAQQQQDRPAPFNIRMTCELGEVLLERRDFAQAEPFLRLYLAMAKKKLPDSWRQSDAVSALGACLLGQKKYADAESLLEQGYAGLRQYEETIPARFQRARLTEALERLVLFYDETGKPDKGAQWRRELKAVKGTTLAPVAGG
jgi:uncharacterized protein HemY